MGKPTWANPQVSVTESIGYGREPGELKHLSSPRKRDYSVSSGERTRNSPNRCANVQRGCRTWQKVTES